MIKSTLSSFLKNTPEFEIRLPMSDHKNLSEYEALTLKANNS